MRKICVLSGVCTRVSSIEQLDSGHASYDLPPSLCCSASNCGGYRNSILIEVHPRRPNANPRDTWPDAKPKRESRYPNEHAAHGTTHEVRYSSVSMKVSLQEVQELAWAVVPCLGGGLACSCSLRDYKPLPIYPITIPPKPSPRVRPWPLQDPRVLSTPLLAPSHMQPNLEASQTPAARAYGAVAPLACTRQTASHAKAAPGELSGPTPPRGPHYTTHG